MRPRVTAVAIWVVQSSNLLKCIGCTKSDFFCTLSNPRVEQVQASGRCHNRGLLQRRDYLKVNEDFLVAPSGNIPLKVDADIYLGRKKTK